MDSYTSETGLCLSELSHAIKNLSAWAAPVKAGPPALFPFSKCSVKSEPYGVALILAPWNYPFGLAVSPLVGAIAAGNCAVVKPSELSANASSVLAGLLGECFDEGYVAVVEGGADDARALLKERFDYIFYTGGTAVGREVMRAAAENLTPLTLELGGKNPCIVDGKCDVKRAAARIAWAKFLNAGQTCIAPDYVLARREIKERLAEELCASIRKFYGENPKESKEYSRIISRRHFDRIVSYLKGCSILCGGEADAEDLYVAPTIVADVPKDSPLLSEEIFGPILPVIEYSETSEAIEYVNSLPKPLAIYLFSRDAKTREKILSSTSSGGVCVNDALIHASSLDLPFGGVGESGFGRYRGRHSFDAFSYRRSVLENGRLIRTPRYPPYGKNALGIVKRILR